MDKIKAKIYYIYHSGFAIETEKHFLVFDYYKEPNLSSKNPLFPSLLAAEHILGKKKVFVFSSHSHGDHFNPIILDWERYNSDITYVLSKDITTINNKPNYFFMEENDELTLSDLNIKAYGSTDIGISFFVQVSALRIFHAGDLNWWHWKEDSFEEQTLAELNFKLQIEKLKQEKTIDIAFFPVDPRLEDFYHIGGEYFCEQLKPILFVPMHFDDNFYITKDFSKKIQHLHVRPVEIESTQQEITFHTN